MGDEKLGDVAEAVLAIGRPESPHACAAASHVWAINQAIVHIEAILRWAGAVVAWPPRWPPSRAIADMLG